MGDVSHVMVTSVDVGRDAMVVGRTRRHDTIALTHDVPIHHTSTGAHVMTDHMYAGVAYRHDHIVSYQRREEMG